MMMCARKGYAKSENGPRNFAPALVNVEIVIRIGSAKVPVVFLVGAPHYAEAYLRHTYRLSDADVGGMEGCDGYAYYLRSDKGKKRGVIFVVWMAEFKYGANDVEVLLHELVHVLDYATGRWPRLLSERYGEANRERRANLLSKLFVAFMARYSQKLIVW